MDFIERCRCFEVVVYMVPWGRDYATFFDSLIYLD